MDEVNWLRLELKWKQLSETCHFQKWPLVYTLAYSMNGLKSNCFIIHKFDAQLIVKEYGIKYILIS